MHNDKSVYVTIVMQIVLSVVVLVSCACVHFRGTKTQERYIRVFVLCKSTWQVIMILQTSKVRVLLCE